MCGLGKNVEAGEIPSGIGEALGCQELFHRKMGASSDRRPVDVHNSDQTRTRGWRRFFWFFWEPMRVVGG
jgi:hypothetical protein